MGSFGIMLSYTFLPICRPDSQNPGATIPQFFPVICSPYQIDTVTPASSLGSFKANELYSVFHNIQILGDTRSVPEQPSS